MRLLVLAGTVFLLSAVAFGFSSTTAPIQAESDNQSGEVKAQQEACNGLEVGEVDYNTSVEGQTLNFQGMFCAPNIGYTLEESDISVEDSNITARAEISEPQGITGPAITPMNFKASENLEPGDYNLEISVEVEGHQNISENTDLNVERPKMGMIQRIRSFISGLF